MTAGALHGEEYAQIIPGHRCIIAGLSCIYGHFCWSGQEPILFPMNVHTFRTRISLDDLATERRPVPFVGPGDVLLHMRAASLNYRDLAIARGEYGAYSAPLVPLSDGAGHIVAVGSAVRDLAVGELACPAYVPDWSGGAVDERVARRRLGGPDDGVLAEYVLVDQRALVRAPSHLDATEAATLPIAGVSAWQALFADGKVSPGEVVAVQGTGGVSLFVALLARAAGARVVMVVRDRTRVDLVHGRIGDDVIAIDSSASPDWQLEVLHVTAGRGVDLFVDLLGGEALGRAIASTRVGGTVSAMGFVLGRSAQLDLTALIRRAITIRATSGGSRASFEGLVRTMEAHRLRPIVDRVFPQSQLRQAYDHLARGRPFGKVVVGLDAPGAPA
ncbi:MAG TPA: NAD(P)-dependent alcohol dehydrogenase [Labilithrix sp.]|nr:NAD(P)-dependent alcohol dehydrogenase [Labilithrix sp.]